MAILLTTPAVYRWRCDRCGDEKAVTDPRANELRPIEPEWPHIELEAIRSARRWLLCPACAQDLVTFMVGDTDVEPPQCADAPDCAGPGFCPVCSGDDDGPESVPEGAEGVGPGAPGKRWSVRNVEHVQSTSGDDADIEHVPPSALELVEALRERRARVEARINSRRLCDGPLHIAGALQSCPHFAWMERADHHLCLACAHAYDQLKAPTPRADVCVCGHLRRLHQFDSRFAGSRCTCTLDGGASCDCTQFRSELATTAETW